MEPAFAADMVVLLDTTPSADLASEGMVRELISRVQRLRKKASLVPTDDVKMEYSVVSQPAGSDLAEVIRSREALLVSALRGKLEENSAPPAEGSLILEEEHDIGDVTLLLKLLKV